MVVNCNSSTDCSSATHMEHSSLSQPELLIAKREPGTADSSKRCRPVSAKSALEPVDEEPLVTDSKQKCPAMTVDRGVGPTPVPPNLSADSSLPNRKQFVSPYLPTSPLEQSAFQQSLAYYYAAQVAGISPISFSSPSPVGQPLSANTHEGRYMFNHASFHHPSPGRMVGSPTHSDLSLFSNAALASPMDRLAAQMHWDRSQKHLQQMGSPFNLGDISKKSSASGEIPVTPQSGSITLPPSLNSSRLTSPRPSLVGGKGRKRALSHSPLSEFLDIQSLTRSSEGSLHFTPLLHNSNSRSSSVASGSYGHLSAGSLASLTPTLKSTSPFLHAAAALYPGLQLPFPVPPFQPQTAMHMTPASIAQQQLLHQHINSSHIKQEDMARDSTQQHEKCDGSTVVSSTVPAVDEQPGSVASASARRDGEDEQQDFKETCCRWEECTQQFPTHEDLVKHVNQDHINSNRKTFICRWRDCCRQEKPFKAQYMLVVHMRRHTGEKPHKCQGFPGCNKAYSRLENLKTHMRSHTGERPYLCDHPGCQKAFSNASDRAKHQNRTHSNEKPYACAIDGCSKRYTDPSSLRKHVKTVHGAEFYARKKHKGLDTPGCRNNNSCNGKSDNSDSGRKNSVEECLTVTRLVDDRRVGQNAAPMTTDDQGSPHSDIDVGINMMKEENVMLAHSPMAVVQEADVEDGDGYQQRGEGGQSFLIGRASQRLNTVNLRAKQISNKSTAFTSLPSISNVSLGGQKTNSGSGLTIAQQGPSKTTGGRQLPEIIEPANQKETRRDSNTSTISSYMSSLKSDVSPGMYNSRFSSRRSSETSRLSIINSPYEYDMAGNLPDRTNKELNSVTDQMERAKLGSQPNLFVQSQSMNLLSPLARREGLRREVNGYRKGRDNEGWRTATPAHTPLPHEYPQHERRRASDPVRCVDHNFSELKKLQQRYYSLNAVKPLPIPNSMRSLRTKHHSYDTVQSSRSSVYTNGYDNGCVDLEENNLDMKMIEDNDDVIIPDDMKQFLQQRRQLERQNRLNSLQGGTTPAVTATSFDDTVENWVQQATSATAPGHCHDKRLGDYGYPPQCTAQYPQHYQYSRAPYDPQHACCNSAPYPNVHNGQQYTNFSTPHYGSYQCQPAYPPNHICHGSHPGVEMHSLTGCGHPAAYNQTPVMPPPHSSNTAAPHHLHSQVGGVPSNQPPYPQYHGTPYANHNLGTNCHPPQTGQASLSQKLSSPCEVSSSTDRNSQSARDAVNPPDSILDNLSTVSGVNGLSHASHNFSSVSQTQPAAGDAASNLVINNMSSILYQFNEENKYLNNQH